MKRRGVGFGGGLRGLAQTWLLAALMLVLPAPAAWAASSYVISRFAGNGTACASAPSCGDGGPAISAAFHDPYGVAVDSNGDVYIADTLDNEVRMVSPSGKVTRFAGNGSSCGDPAGGCGNGGPATSAELNQPEGVAVGSNGDVYIADTGDSEVRMVSPSGTITRFAGDFGVCTPPNGCGDGGPAKSAALTEPVGVAVDSGGDVYIADSGAYEVRMVSSAGTISRIAGDGNWCHSPPNGCGDGGPATSAELSQLGGVAVDSKGDVYIADTGDSEVRMVSPSGTITRFAGDAAGCTPPNGCGDGGPATSAELGPSDVAVGPAGDVYIADTANNEVRMVSPSGTIIRIAGNGSMCSAPPHCGDGGPATSAQLSPIGLAVNGAGKVFVADGGGADNEVRLLTPPSASGCAGWSAKSAVAPLPATVIAGRTLDQPVAVFTLPASSGGSSPPAFHASIAWRGHGAAARASVRERTRKGVLEFAIVGSHRFLKPGGTRADVLIACSDGTAVGASVPVRVLPRDPGASFYSNPHKPTAGDLALLVPEGAAPGQRKVVKQVWAFADGGPRVIDSPRTDREYMSVARGLVRSPGSRRLRKRAERLAILPPRGSFFGLRGILGIGKLSSGEIRGIAKVWVRYFPLHIVPHVYFSHTFPNVHGTVQVAHEVIDSAGVKRHTVRTIRISRHCYTYGGGWIPVLSRYTTCDTFRGFAAAADQLKRLPDYYAFDFSGSPVKLFGVGVTVTVTNDGSVFLGMHAGLGVGVSLPLGVSVAAGYVLGSPHLRAPADGQVDDFVDGWTIPVQAYAGVGYSLIYSPAGPRDHKLGEEFAGTPGAGAGVQPGCAVDLGKIRALAGLSPRRFGRFRASRLAALFARVVPPELPTLISQATPLLPQTSVCVHGAVDPASVLFGG